MTQEYFYTPLPNKPCKRLCDRCTLYQICPKEEGVLDNKTTMTIFRHKKTGNPCLVITDNFRFKQDGKWLEGLVLYQTLYPNPDGMYFARTKEDFEENFEKVK